ncbi:MULTISPECIES: hypothetical protein [unclassified Pseudomonas]|jgi:hypothetical protein|uniref:hypothetical protein n=1 Tax=unclassified Pseudomonas TaxID=196821 RepID=UPI00249C7B9B|nr:hypothetical protein [Pseudomonas sp. PS02290]
MATYRIDDKHDITLRPAERIAKALYRCEGLLGLTDGSLTNSRFLGEGKTASQAENSARTKARFAVAAGQIEYVKADDSGD